MVRCAYIYREGWQNASGTTDAVFGWDSTTSVTRELKADLASQTLTFYPLAELASLRTQQLLAATALPLEAGRATPLIGTLRAAAADETPHLTFYQGVFFFR